MKKILSLVLAMLLLTAFAACNTTVEVDEDTYADGDQYSYIGGELNVLNWGEYIDEELIALFEQETGVKVNYIEMTSNEE
ncbi:MAG: spermidine/putrescine ABC transporter substrate-binding protein, partial [Clostridia bacterium]|nr:spermidine/putrescine ABC transporter substrate-binding protein [Clostridia bacterium]